jgi:hypothetical protein
MNLLAGACDQHIEVWRVSGPVFDLVGIPPYSVGSCQWRKCHDDADPTFGYSLCYAFHHGEWFSVGYDRTDNRCGHYAHRAMVRREPE